MAAAGAGRPGTVTRVSTERQREGAGQHDPALSVPCATSSDDLVGQRIVVRAYHPSDAPAVWHGIEESRASLARWIPDLARRRTHSEVRAGIEQLCAARARGERLLYGIWRRSDEQFLGEVGLHDVDLRRGAATVGYWLPTSARGQGLIDEALYLLHSYAIGKLGLRQLEAHIASDNVASRRVAERHAYLMVRQRPTDPMWDGEAATMLIYSLMARSTPGD